MSVERLAAGWDAAAREDAMFNILTDPERGHGGWSAEDFFATGTSEIRAVMRRVGPTLHRRERALDFGCGLGRTTQALTGYFKRVDGCDVSPEMLRQARALSTNRQVRYYLNGEALPFRDRKYDFLYTMITLQHMPPGLVEGYIHEFVRVLAPRGVAVFEIPYIEFACPSDHWLAMWGAAPELVKRWVNDAGAELVRVDASYASGPGVSGWEYTIRRPAKRRTKEL